MQRVLILALVAGWTLYARANYQNSDKNRIFNQAVDTRSQSFNQSCWVDRSGQCCSNNEADCRYYKIYTRSSWYSYYQQLYMYMYYPGYFWYYGYRVCCVCSSQQSTCSATSASITPTSNDVTTTETTTSTTTNSSTSVNTSETTTTTTTTTTTNSTATTTSPTTSTSTTPTTTSSNSTTRVCTQRRILGGQPVDSPDQWPWMVSIKLGTPANPGPHRCAGVLVAGDKVVTTAECVTGHDDIFVTVRERDVIVPNEVNEDNVNVIRSVLHADYNLQSGSVFSTNNIAMLTLERSVLSDVVQAVCLAPGQRDLTEDGQTCRIAGWGINGLGTHGELHDAEVTMRSNEMCAIYLSFLKIANLPEDKLCSPPFANACPGDNGGMLVCEDSPGTWNLYGVISDNGCEKNLPVIYTDISAHLAWIDANM